MTSVRVLRPVPVVMAAFLVFATPLVAAAAESEHEGKPLSKQAREQMAGMHDKFAACLRSDKPVSECRKEMKATCMEMMKDGGCMHMGMGMEQHGHEQPPK